MFSNKENAGGEQTGRGSIIHHHYWRIGTQAIREMAPLLTRLDKMGEKGIVRSYRRLCCAMLESVNGDGDRNSAERIVGALDGFQREFVNLAGNSKKGELAQLVGTSLAPVRSYAEYLYSKKKRSSLLGCF